jgi:hypothetical protein
MDDRFSGLRCRPGDLAVIVQDEPECQANIGQIVQVIQEYEEFGPEWGFHWVIQPLSKRPSAVLIGRPGSKNRHVVYDNNSRAHADAWLRPLLDTNDPDEMTLVVKKPKKTTSSRRSRTTQPKKVSS